jgi:cytoskeletal protein CcmA (bactofilin family)
MGIFAKDKPEAAASDAARSDSDTAFFGAKLSIKGKVTGSGNLIVMGKLEGEVDLAGELVVAAPAVLNGDIRAVTLAVSGTVTGTLTAGEKIHLEKSAVVSGRMNTPRLSVVDGAMFNGEIEMKKPNDGIVPPKRSDKK